MSLRVIKKKVPNAAHLQEVEESGDNWSTRVVKLIPAESLGLYGTGSAIVPQTKPEGLWILATACLFLTLVFRYRATKSIEKKTQTIAVAIAGISFILWLLALEPPVGPFNLGENAYLAALFALIWGVGVPAFYKGNEQGS